MMTLSASQGCEDCTDCDIIKDVAKDLETSSGYWLNENEWLRSEIETLTAQREELMDEVFELEKKYRQSNLGLQLSAAEAEVDRLKRKCNTLILLLPKHKQGDYIHE